MTRLLHLSFLGFSLAFLVAGCQRVHVGDNDGGTMPPEDAGPQVACGDALCDPGLVCCNASCGICATPGLACTTIACVDDCSTNSDCAASEYCLLPAGQCPGPLGGGTCVPRPETCDLVLAPVCGCDGATHSNACSAASAGVNVASEGACTGGECAAQDAVGEGLCDAVLGVAWDGSGCVTLGGCSCAGADCGSLYTDVASCEAAYASCLGGGSCIGNGDCGAGEYCHHAVGSCGGTGDPVGECRAVPGAGPCPDDGPPVCGCDGVTYGCEGNASANGTSVAHVGSCTDCDADDARPEGPCAAVLGVRWTGTSCETISGCSCAGADCATLAATAEECMLSHTGCDLPIGGNCGGFAGLVCRPDEWCDYADGDLCGGADGLGVCRPRPDACPPVLGDVCACDGRSYANDCEAHAAGYDTWPAGGPGGCGAPPPAP